MKFFTATVFAMVSSLAGCAFARPLSQSSPQSYMANSLRKTAFTRSLIRNSIPVDEKGNPRQLEEEFEITGEYSIQFDTCISLRTGPEEDNEVMFYNDIVSYTQAGQIVKEKSYVLFKVCKTFYCDYYGDDPDSLYMIDIESYMNSLTEFYQQEQEQYCTACAYNYNYCQYVKEQEAKQAQYYKSNGKYEQASMAESQYESSYNDNYKGDTNYYKYDRNSYDGNVASNSYGYNGGYGQNYGSNQNSGGNSYNQQQYGYYGQGSNRNLESDMSAYKVLNCTKCDEMLCNANNYQNAQGQQQQQGNDGDEEAVVDIESVTQWIQEIAECKQTGATFLDQGTYPLYAGFMCNDDGTGIEIALFLDEECSVYTSLQSFKKVASEQYDAPYMTYAKNIILYPIENDVSCNENFQYVSQDMYSRIQKQQQYGYNYNNYNGNNNNGQQNNNQNDRQEATEFCRRLFEGGEGGETASIGNCPQKNNQNNNGNGYYYGQGEGVTLYYDYYHPWYSYVVTAEDADESSNVCPIIKAMNGEYSYIYQLSGSGSIFKDSTTHSGSSNVVFDYLELVKERMAPHLIALVVCAVLVATIAFACVLYSCCYVSSVPNQYTAATDGVREKRQGMESKRERLVDATTGKLA